MKPSTMADIRASGKLLAGASSVSADEEHSLSTFVAAMFRRSYLIHADDSHSVTFLLDPVNFKTITWVLSVVN
jgi:hypothetical protein